MKTHRNRVRFAAAAAALLCTGVMPAGAFVPVESSVFGSDSYAAYASAGHTGKSPASPLSLDMREPAHFGEGGNSRGTERVFRPLSEAGGRRLCRMVF